MATSIPTARPSSSQAGAKGELSTNERKNRDAPDSLDLVFCIDSTSSMGRYISAAQQNVQGIVEALVAFEKCDVRFGLVAYRDHPPQDKTFVTQKFAFTSSPATIRRNVNTMEARGGGDGPESVCCGLHDALHMDWRKEATKVVVLIADAPPHGLGEIGDGFPNGCPDGRDPLATARQMAEEGICVYTVGCEPAISYYGFAADFMVGVADVTGGQAVTLSSAHHLVDVILGGAQEEIALERLMSDMDIERQAAVAAVGATRSRRGKRESVEEGEAGYDEYCKEIASDIHTRMKKKGVETKQLKHNTSIAAPNAKEFVAASGLEEWRKSRPAALSPALPPFRSGGRGGGRGTARRSSSRFAFGFESPAADHDVGAVPPDPAVCFDAAGPPRGAASGAFSFAAPPAPPGAAMPAGGTFGVLKHPASSAATAVSVSSESISYEQVARMMGKHRSRSRAVSNK